MGEGDERVGAVPDERHLAAERVERGQVAEVGLRTWSTVAPTTPMRARPSAAIGEAEDQVPRESPRSGAPSESVTLLET